MVAFIIILLILIAWFFFDPFIDFTEDSILLWYSNIDGSRKYIVLWLRKQ